MYLYYRDLYQLLEPQLAYIKHEYKELGEMYDEDTSLIRLLDKLYNRYIPDNTINKYRHKFPAVPDKAFITITYSLIGQVLKELCIM